MSVSDTSGPDLVPNVDDIIGRTAVMVFLWRAIDGWPVGFASDNVSQLGYRPEDFYSGRLKYADLIHPDDRARVVAEVAQHEARGEDSYELQYRVCTRAGDLRHVEERTVARRSPEGQVTHYEGVVLDVTRRRLAEERLDEQLHLLQILLDAIPIPVFYKDAAGPYRGCNHGFAEMAGRPREEIIGRQVREVWPPEFADKFEQEDEALLGHAGRQAYELTLRFGDGSIHDVLLNRATFRDTAGRLAGIVGVADDMTERNRAMRLLHEAREALEARVQQRTSELTRANASLSQEIVDRQRAEALVRRSEAKYRELADSLPQTVFEADAEGRLTWVNRNAARVFGYEREALSSGVRALDLVAPADREHAEAALLRACTGEEVDNVEVLVQRADGSTFPVMVSLRPMAGDAEPCGVRGLIVDITWRVELERMKTEFLSIASHELRTPLTPLRLLLQQSRRRLQRGDPIEATSFERMERQTRRLADMVNDLLEVSRLERGTLTVRLAPMDLRAGVTAVVEDFRSQFADRAIELALPDEPVDVDADVTRIEQVVANLVDNALKFAPDSTVEVRVSADEHWAQVTVSDHGPGIPADYRESLFTRFYRTGPAATRTQKGLGLGLFISREIMVRHGGSIGVDSEPGRGASFYIRLPRRSLAGSEPETPPATPAE